MARHKFTEEEAAAQDALNNSPEEIARREREREEILRTGRRERDGATLIQGTVSPDFGGSQFGDNRDTTAYDTDVERARRMGGEGQNRAAVQLDQTQANESRAMQVGALGMLRRQADGSAPSAAGILSQRANQNAVQGAGMQQTAARGIGARIATTGTAGQAASQQMLAGNAANAAARAGEVSQGQGAYAGGAGAVQGQDINAATTNAQLEAQKRAMNEQRQQEFERRAWNTRNMQSSAEDRYQRNTNQALQLHEAKDLAKQANKAAEDATTMGVVNSGFTGMLGSAKYAAEEPSAAAPKGTTSSDPKTKEDIRPLTMGSLSSLRRSYGRS